jgi:hypothetical protein
VFLHGCFQLLCTAPLASLFPVSGTRVHRHVWTRLSAEPADRRAFSHLRRAPPSQVFRLSRKTRQMRPWFLVQAHATSRFTRAKQAVRVLQISGPGRRQQPRRGKRCRPESLKRRLVALMQPAQPSSHRHGGLRVTHLTRCTRAGSAQDWQSN